MTWLIAIVSLIGVWLNIRKRRICFILWAGTNSAWMIIDFYHGIYAQSALFAVYPALSVYGFIAWRRVGLDPPKQGIWTPYSARRPTKNRRTGDHRMRNVYLAARYGRRKEMLEIADRLEAVGLHVTSRWIAGMHDDVPDRECAVDDLKDLRVCDTLISFTESPGYCPGRGRGGRHVEFGIALATGKRLIVIGHRDNVFHSLPQVEYYDCIEQFLVNFVYPIPCTQAEAPS